MVNYYWVGGTNSDFEDGSNWTDGSGGSAFAANNPPDSNDNINFDATASATCKISDARTVANVYIRTDFDQLFEFDNSSAVLTCNHLDVQVGGKIKASATAKIKFTGGGIEQTSPARSTFATDSSATRTAYGPFDSATSRNNMTYDYSTVSNGKWIVLENGVYPHLDFSGNSNLINFFPCDQSDTTGKGTNYNNYTTTQILNFITDNNCKVKVSQVRAADIDKIFQITGKIHALCQDFKWGLTTLQIQPLRDDDKFPHTGHYYNTGSSFHKWGAVVSGSAVFNTQYHKLIIAANSTYNFKMEPTALLVCDELVINADARLYGPNELTNQGSEINCVQRPTVLGDWNFVQIADGVYRTRNHGPSLNYTHGGTGLSTLGTANQVLAMDANGVGIEWSSTAGGGGLDAVDINDTDSGFTWGTNDVSSITTLKLVAGANVALASDTSEKAIRITSTDTNTTTTADVLSALNADFGGNKTFGTDVADTVTFSGPITAGYIDGLNGLRSTKTSTNTTGDNTTYSIRANVSQHSGSTVLGISRLQGIYINNSSGSANHSGQVYQHGIKIEMTGTAAGTSENRGIEILSSGADKNYGLIVANAVTSGFGISSPDITSIAEFQRNAKAIVKLTSTDTNNSSNSSDTVLEMKTGHASALNQLVFSDPDASAAGRLNYLHASNRFVFEIGGSSVGSITASGFTGAWDGDAISVVKGGTGQTSYTNGQLLIGNTTGNTLAKATLTAGSNITITNGAGSISIAGTANDDVTVANLKTRLAGGFGSNAVQIGDSDDVVTIGNKLIVSGDLTVSGTTTTVNSTTLTTADCLISLATGQTANGADALDIGFYGTYNDGSDSNTQKWRGFFYDKSGSKWKLFTGLDTQPTTTVSTASSDGFALDSLKLLNLEATGTITGSLTGNADTATNATNASNVGITEDNSTDASFYPSFVNGTSGNKAHKVDSGLTYNPSTGTLTSAGFQGTLTGNASGLSSTLVVSSGGTGATTLTSNAVLTGNGTSAIQAESNLTFTGGTLTVKGDKSNEEAILKIQPVATSSRDAVLVVEGARNLSTTSNTAMIRLQNHDNHLSDDNQYNILGAIVGRVTDTTDNHGDMHFLTYVDGATASETMTLTGGGKVGIGTTGPDTTLHVAGTSHRMLPLERQTQTAGYWSGIEFQLGDDASATAGHIYGIIGGAIEDPATGSKDGALIFHTSLANTTAEKMRITSDGKVGIGINAPDDILHVKGTDAALLVEDAGSNSNPAIEIKNDAAHWKLQNRGGDSDKLRIVEGSTTHMVIQQNNGNVGIGDTTPSHKLDVNGTVKGTDVRAATSLGFDNYQMRGTDGVVMQKQPTSGTTGAILGTKSPGNFQAGFEFDQDWLAVVNTSDGNNDWANGVGLCILTINVGNVGGTSHTDVFHGGTITLSLSINKDNSDHHSEDSIWSQTVNFVALGGGNFNANTKVDYSIENTLGRKGDESEANDLFNIDFDVEQINSKYYVVMNVKNMTGATLDKDDTGLLITGSLNLLKGQAHTG